MTEDEAWDLLGRFDEEKIPVTRTETGTATIEAPVTVKEKVNHPDHYNAGGIECIDAIEAALTGCNGFEGFCLGNTLKYIWRWQRKGGLTDLQKARFYLDRVIKEQEAYHGKS